MRPEDERRHLPGDDPEWCEWWWFSTREAPGRSPGWVPSDLVGPPESESWPARQGSGPALEGSAEGPLHLSVGLCLLPNQGRACYWAGLDGPGMLPVVVADDSVPIPQAGLLEIRTEGLWADHAIEAALEQMGLGCEAFALRLSSWDDLQAEPLVGDRVPFGFDVEWATADGERPQPLEATSEQAGRTGPGSRGYRLACTVFGEILVGDHRLDIDTLGYRVHGWTT